MKREEVKQKKKKKKFRIKFKVLFITFFVLYIIGNIIYNTIDKPISNIYIKGNKYLTDWEVIKAASLDNYPPTLLTPSSKIESNLEKNILVKSATVYKKRFTVVYIEVEENRPIYYDQIYHKTVLLDGTKVDTKYDVPILNSTINEDDYKVFIEAMRKIPTQVLNKMSEITYSPDDVDSERYVISMTDGNYVYITLKKLGAINLYNDYVKQFNNKKGILYLNSGDYFKIMEN